MPVTTTEHALLTAYPVTPRQRDAAAERLGVRLGPSLALAEARRGSLPRLFGTLRALRAERLWVLVGDLELQPLLPLLLLAASLTRARAIEAADFAGRRRRCSRAAIWLWEPPRLLYWSARGLYRLWRMNGEAGGLLRSERAEPRERLAQRPRVAYLKTSASFGVSAGGSVGHVAGVVNALVRSGLRVRVVSADEPPMLDAGAELVRLFARGATGLPLDGARALLHELFVTEAGRLFEQERPDLLYQRYTLASYAGVALSRRFGVPLVTEYNGSEIWAARHWGLAPTFPRVLKRMEEVMLRHAHVVVVVSEVLRDELIQRGVPPARIACHPNGVDPEIFDPTRWSAADAAALRERIGLPADTTLCTFLGTFGPWHGVDVLAEAVARLASERPAWLEASHTRFVFVGDGARMPQVRARLAGVDPDLYRLVGLVPQEEAPAWLAASDVLLSPHVPNPDGSRFFGSPTKLFEYMAMGKAILASELEQIGEVLAGSHHLGRDPAPSAPADLGDSVALLATPGSVDELIAGLRVLASSPQVRARLGSAARARALERYTWRRHVEAILERVRAVATAS